jgi:fatty-acyl-CoA synthase
MPRGELPDHVAVDDVANIQYTSGTTGLPKGVMLTHHNIVNNGQFLAQGFHYTEQDKIVVPVPLFHCYGCVIGTMSALNYRRGHHSAQLDLRRAGHAEGRARRARHIVYGVPAMYVAEMALPDFAELRPDQPAHRHDERRALPGGADEARARRDALPRTGHRLRADGDLAGGDHERRRDSIEDPREDVGRAMPQTEIRLSPGRNRRDAAGGEQGEVCVRGYALMKGYDGDPEGTAQVIKPDGWLHTGDLGVMREDGCIHLTGRSRDVIIRGGENIYPREVEEFLYTHPKVDEVQVVGIPNARLGEIVAAWVRLRPGVEATEEEIREFCKGQIAYYKIPEHIRFVDEFPATLSGKIQKYKMREFEIEARGLQRWRTRRRRSEGSSGRIALLLQQ